MFRREANKKVGDSGERGVRILRAGSIQSVPSF